MSASVIAKEPERRAAADWPTYNRDLAGTRYSPLDQINTRTVSALREVWSYRFHPEDGFIEGPSPEGMSGWSCSACRMSREEPVKDHASIRALVVVAGLVFPTAVVGGQEAESPGPRIPPLESADGLNITKTLAHHPELADAWGGFAGYFFRDSILESRKVSRESGTGHPVEDPSPLLRGGKHSDRVGRVPGRRKHRGPAPAGRTESQRGLSSRLAQVAANPK